MANKINKNNNNNIKPHIIQLLTKPIPVILLKELPSPINLNTHYHNVILGMILEYYAHSSNYPTFNKEEYLWELIEYFIFKLIEKTKLEIQKLLNKLSIFEKKTIFKKIFFNNEC
ncbi:hypothetical protein DICPUDRAFT_76532 [Dictyostelium purpureum]|uniref:Uncharacterized protein n=1 Tax=Dictyostelium purpureum TaxID=5786 RepID=F0ZDW6_DICPU|nr:uncharacterized protein DICPUDRAFT_76532 [Dictyostelium purpureum]EGC37852.1 hypothetical protein DICPUDRAFT_76532 [Dictyostelium purpureum]|eukprot:XP_003285602.1 hypothetical protein DICPUDRAFT_76532 [Dictyostelium purpureum]